jgi:serine O-acetyltransferase
MFFKLRQDRLANAEPTNIAGRRTLFVYRFGQWRMTIKNRFFRAPLSWLYRQMEKHVRFKYGIELPYTVELGDRVVFEHQHGIVIHGNAKIGHDSIIRQGVTIGNKNIDFPLDAPTIGCRVNIGAGAKIFGKVTIGNDVDIGANAVVISDIPDNSVAVGIPAKVIKIKS